MKKLYKSNLKFNLNILCKIIKFELKIIIKHKRLAEKWFEKITTLECESIFEKMDERKKYL